MTDHDDEQDDPDRGDPDRGDPDGGDPDGGDRGDHDHDGGSSSDEARPAPPPPELPDDGSGDGVLRLSWVGTVLLAVTGVAGALVPEPLAIGYVVVALALFAVGFVVFVGAYLRAVGRSRHDLIGMGGLFFLTGSAPRRVRRSAMGSLAAEVVVSLVVASVGFAAIDDASVNPLAFGILAPLWGLAWAGWWGAAHGTFPPRPDGEPRPDRPGARPESDAACGRGAGGQAGRDR